MAVPWGWILFLVGIAYGYMSPGKTQKMEIFKKGLLVGVVLGVVLGLIQYATGQDILGLGLGEGIVAIIVSVVILTILFILGAWIGDWLEHRMKKTPA
ncbi:MAG: hypothetical protein ACT4PT_00170 [Methanobacteriota archaeon]